MVSVNGLVPVRHLTKTFASGKTEKMVYQVELFKIITMIMMVNLLTRVIMMRVTFGALSDLWPQTPFLILLPACKHT